MNLGLLVSSDIVFVDFGNFRPASIHGYKFEDINGNGVDDDEPRLAGVDITLNDGLNPSITMTTDSNGDYWFSNLLPGTYTVTETAPTGSTQTTANPAPITLLSGDVITPADDAALAFGNFFFASINGYKFEDVNGNGVDDGEPRLAGVDITLNDGVNPSITVQTDGNGNYGFSNLGPGIYTVTETAPGGSIQTTINPAPIAPISGDVITPADDVGLAFGNFEKFTLSGVKFRDDDFDGVHDTGEPTLADWTIFLDTNNNGQPDDGPGTVTTTAGDGSYSFPDLEPGTYRPREVQQAGFEQTAPVPDVTFVGQSGQDMTVDFGNGPGPAFRGIKFNDRNANGTQDGNEEPLAGFVIELYQDMDNDGVFEPNGPFDVSGDDGDPLVTAVTNALGVYRLGNQSLPSATYFIREVPLPGWTQTFPASVDFYMKNYVTGNSIAGLDFGNQACGAIHQVTDGTETVTSEREGILTIALSQGSFSVNGSLGGTFSAYDGLGSLLTGQTSVNSYTDTDGRARVDILIDGAGTPAITQFDVVITGSGGAATLDFVNAVNVDIGGSLALIVIGTDCGETIVVGDDEGGASSDAKAIFFGAVNGTINAASDLTASGVHYRTAIINAVFGLPSISRVEVNGRAGDDVIRVKADITQQSVLRGGPGNDNIRAGSGRGTIFGETGHDLLVGGVADDVFNGGDGHDRIYGGAGADRAFGGNGNDWIAGGDDSDPLLRGGNGNDVISGGAGRDRLLGDSGFDTLYRDAFDLLVSVGSGGGAINNTPPDPVDQALRELIDNNWFDSFVLNENSDGLDNDFDGLIDEADELADDDGALDTLDELINAILP